METNSEQEMRVAVKCKVCQRVIFYKTTPLSGKIELKCPRRHQITNINLAYRRSKHPLFYRRISRKAPSSTSNN